MDSPCRRLSLPEILWESSKDIVPKFECKSLKGLQQAFWLREGQIEMRQLPRNLPHLFPELLQKPYFALAAALIKESPLGTPQPVTLSQPEVTVSEVSVPKLISTYSPSRFQNAL